MEANPNLKLFTDASLRLHASSSALVHIVGLHVKTIIKLQRLAQKCKRPNVGYGRGLPPPRIFVTHIFTPGISYRPTRLCSSIKRVNTFVIDCAILRKKGYGVKLGIDDFEFQTNLKLPNAFVLYRTSVSILAHYNYIMVHVLSYNTAMQIPACTHARTRTHARTHTYTHAHIHTYARAHK